MACQQVSTPLAGVFSTAASIPVGIANNFIPTHRMPRYTPLDHLPLSEACSRVCVPTPFLHLSLLQSLASPSEPYQYHRIANGESIVALHVWCPFLYVEALIVKAHTKHDALSLNRSRLTSSGLIQRHKTASGQSCE